MPGQSNAAEAPDLEAPWSVVTGDCVEVMAAMPAESVNAVVCDPPYGFAGGFMGKAWDAFDGRDDVGLGYYLSGLIDGEGSFRVGAGERRCEFTLKMRDDDVRILERARTYLGHGRIAREPPRGGTRPQARLVIDTRDGCAALAAFLDRFPLRAKKARDAATWVEAVHEWLTGERGNRWSGPADRARLATLAQRLRDGRAYSEVPYSGHRFQDWTRTWAAEALRVLRPGGHLLAFGGTRTAHRLVCGIEDAGFEVRDTITWLYGQGFPKSLDVAKAITATQTLGGSSRTQARRAAMGDDYGPNTGAGGGAQRTTITPTVHAPEQRHITPDAERWQGWGTALKPACEPIVVARKPLAGTVAENVLAHGTGALNLDGCRIGFAGRADEEESKAKNRHGDFDSAPRNDGSSGIYGADMRTGAERGNYEASGRWPANVLLDEDAAAMLDDQAGDLAAGVYPASRRGDEPGSRSVYGQMRGQSGLEARRTDAGGASRFFYVAKASAAERNAGLERFAPEVVRQLVGQDGSDDVSEKRNVHPTVKPIELMRWLVRLVTRPGGLVLDPFVGSGTTGCAAMLEGVRFVGIEREPSYVPLARARIAWWQRHPQGVEIVKALDAARERLRREAAGQLGLFGEAE